MKKALIALALVAFATTAQATINGSKHDLNLIIAGGETVTTSDCLYCHAPHKVNTAVAGTPLWNRNLPAAGNFTVYSSTTVGTVNAPGANSLTCLSCHDGVGVLGAMFTGVTKTLNPSVLPALNYANVGTNLQNDHPVGVAYTAAGVSGEFETRITAESRGMVFYAAGPDIRVECGTCHDPHGTSDTGAGGLSFLRGTGDICVACHIR